MQLTVHSNQIVAGSFDACAPDQDFMLTVISAMVGSRRLIVYLMYRGLQLQVATQQP